MLSVEQLQNVSVLAEWPRSLGYVRNKRIHQLAVDESRPDMVVITAIVQVAEAHQVRLIWYDSSISDSCEHDQSGLSPVNLAADCDCPGQRESLCRHATAVGMQFLLQMGDPEAERVLAGNTIKNDDWTTPSDSCCSTARIVSEVEILLHYNRPDNQIRIVPRIIYRELDGRKLARVHPFVVDSGQTPILDDELPFEQQGVWRVKHFFAQWPDLKVDPSGSLSLAGEPGIFRLFGDLIPRMPPDWTVRYDEELEKIKPYRRRLTMQLKLPEIRELGLLSFSVSFHCGQLSITLAELKKHYHDQQLWLVENGRYIEIENYAQIEQLLNLLAAWDNEALMCNDDSHRNANQKQDDYVECASIQVKRIMELKNWIDDALQTDQSDRKSSEQSDSKYPNDGVVILDPSSRQLFHDLTIAENNGNNENSGLLASTTDIMDQVGDSQQPCTPNKELDKRLHPFQKKGVRWLQFLRKWRFGGILADDMGLGKTVQILAFLLSCPRKRPSLIICPKSLLYNWLFEAKRFTPELKVMLIQGTRKNRQYLLRQTIDCDLVITSYPLFQCDLSEYLDIIFETCILDEAQLIKNPDTHLARQIKRIKAGQRLALSGTPIENAKMDLWSIFDFVMPGFLGRKDDFKAKYVDGLGAAQESQDLVRRIRPFLLRRTKVDVLHDLPQKTEETLYVGLTQNQLALYLHTLQQIKKNLRESAYAKMSNHPQMAILAGLTRLRQICNHPGLLFPQYKRSSGQSGKMELFETLLDQCLANQHKVLVFSQFTQMLAIIAEKLVTKRIRFVMLDGQTSDRQSVINQFNQDEQIRVFLISLKAGGFGLNLTAADTVILFDPWWNPMVEEQAADRVHRMGQKQSVTIYRLITQDTIEEKMEHLQRRKRDLFNAIVNEAGNRNDIISMDDLRYLIETPGTAAFQDGTQS